MEDKPVLTLDFGTQSVRAMIFDRNGNTLAISKIHYDQPYYSSKPGYAEQNADYYFNLMCQAIRKLTEEYPDLTNKIIGMSLTCFRDTAVILDKDYKIIRPSILWLDQRQAECKKAFPLINNIAFFLSGMMETISLNRKRTIANWLQENEPENMAKTKHYWALSTYFTYRLTGSSYDTPSNYTGHYPIDMKKGKWMGKHSIKYPVFGIDSDLLPELKPSGSVLGRISADGAKLTGLKEGLPLYGAGGDKSCETLGVGCIKKDMGSVSYGTASDIEVTNKKYIEPETFLPAYASPMPGYYNMEVQVYRGYWMLQWFAENFASEEKETATIEKKAVEEVLNQKLLEIPPGSEGLILQPYWGPGLKRPLAKGVIVGFSDYHTKIHLYRSIIEGIGYALREGLESIEKKQHHKVEELRVSGGGSKSDAICQITADIFGLPVSRVQTYETSSLGCAILIYVSSGIYDTYDEAVRKMVHTSKMFFPDKENVKIYDNLYNKIYKHIYPQMKKINNNIRKYSKHINIQ
jgi:sugar (pentulose or hexulose) kinase